MDGITLQVVLAVIIIELGIIDLRHRLIDVMDELDEIKAKLKKLMTETEEEKKWHTY